MKRPFLKFCKGLRNALIVCGLMAAVHYKQVCKVTLAIAPFALVKKAKKLNPNMTEEEEAGFKLIEDAIIEHYSGLLTMDELEKKMATFKTELETKGGLPTKEKYEELFETVKDQGQLIDQIKSAKNVMPLNLSTKSQLEAHFATEEGKQHLEMAKKGQQFSFVLKAADTMTVAGNTVDASPFATRFERAPGIIEQVVNRPFIVNQLTAVPTNAETLWFVEETNPQGTAQYIGEGDLMPLTDWDYTKTSSVAKKVAVAVKASVEMFEDIDGMASFIDKKVKQRIDIKEDAELLAGDGIGDNIKGLDTYGSAYSLTSISTPTPNLADVIMAGATQIRKLNFYPTLAIISLDDEANLQMKKDKNGQYIIPPFTTANGMTIAGRN